MVKCVFCRVHIKDWTPDMVPDVVHRKSRFIVNICKVLFVLAHFNLCYCPSSTSHRLVSF